MITISSVTVSRVWVDSCVTNVCLATSGLEQKGAGERDDMQFDYFLYTFDCTKQLVDIQLAISRST